MEDLRALSQEIYRAGEKAKHDKLFKDRISEAQALIMKEFNNDEKKKDAFGQIIAENYNVSLCDTFESEADDPYEECLAPGSDGMSCWQLARDAMVDLNKALDDGKAAGLTIDQRNAAVILGEIRYRTLFRR